MRLNRDGGILTGLLALTLFASLASGNNLLYLLYSLMLAALLLSAAALRLSLRSLEVAVDFPETAFQGAPVALRLRVRNTGSWPSFFLRAGWGGSATLIERIPPGGERTATVSAILPHRGLNRLSDLTLSSVFPFGLLEKKILLREEAVGLAFPRPRDVRSAAELDADATESGRMVPRKSGGDELYGIREYDESDDSRIINWKLTARSGKILVNTFASPGGSKVTVRLMESGSGERFERAVVEAASACKFHLLRGADVRLFTPEKNVDYGKGLRHLDRMLETLARLGEGASPRNVGPMPATEGKPEEVPPPDAVGARPGEGLTPLILMSYGVGFLAYASLFLIDEIPPSLLAGIGVLFPLALWQDARGGKRLPPVLWHAASIVVLAYFLLIGWHSAGITVANTYLLLFILVQLIFGSKGMSQLRQIFLVSFLGFFLSSGQTISLWYFLFFLLYAGAASAWLMGAAPGPGHRAYPPVKAWALLLPFLLGVSALAFAATPRLAPLRRMNPFVAMGLDKRRPKKDFTVKFTENVSLGFFGQLKRSAARVMRVWPLTKNLPPYLRIRGSALDRFDGKSWSKSKTDFIYEITGGQRRQRLRRTKAGRAAAMRNGDFLLFPGVRPGVRTNAFQFTLFPLNSSVLFTVGTPILVGKAGMAAYFDHTDTVYFISPYLAGIKYTSYSENPAPLASLGGGVLGDASLTPPAPAGFGSQIEDYDRLLRERYLQLPPLDPRIPALARRITEGKTDPFDKIRALVESLRGGYEYSLYSDDPDRDLAGFLFADRSGNCEYFATAAAVLLRTLGIPSRLVTGFLSDEWNEYGRFFDVRQGNAHAWVEAYVTGKGWVTVDATPAAGRFTGRRRAWNLKILRFYESLQFTWYRHVIGYDRFIQKNTFMRLGRTLDDRRIQDAFERGLQGAGLMILALGLLFGARRSWEYLRRPPDGIFARAARILRRADLRPLRHETPKEFAAHVEKQRPDLAAFGGLVELHYEERYSGRRLAPAERRRAEEILRDLSEKATS